MAICFIEGFERYRLNTPASRLASRYSCSSFAGHSFVAGRNGGYALLLSGPKISATLPTSQTYIAGFAFLSNSDITLFSFDDGSTAQITVEIASGVLRAKCGASVLGAGSTTVSTGAWFYAEVQVTVASSGGSVLVKLNEATTEINATGNTQVTGNARITGFSLHGGRVDDIYVLDTSGDANNAMLGVMVVEGLRPHQPGSSAGWKCKAAPNFASAAELDGRFVYATTTPATDTYAFQNLQRVQTVAGVSVRAEARNTDETTHDLSAVVISLNETSTSAARTVSSTSGQEVSFLYEVNPSTGSVWSADDLNAAEFGLKL